MHKTRPQPCDACRRSKLKCDQAKPTCQTCVRRRRECIYAPVDDELEGRIRRFHHRSKDGCQNCKTRRVRCDEAKPVCGNCSKKNQTELCVYPDRRPSRASTSSVGSPAAAIDSSTRPFDLLFPPIGREDSAVRNSASNWDASSSERESPVLTSFPSFSPMPSEAALSPLDSFLHSNDSNDLLSMVALSSEVQTPPSIWHKQTATVCMLDDDGSDCIEVNTTSTAKQPDLAVKSVWHKRRTPSPTYLYQSLLVQHPDELMAFFPSSEQRHQYRHFFNETAQVLIVIPTDQPRNPWLSHLTHLALGKAHGEDLAHDALRLGLLCLASFDIGFKMQTALQNQHDNAMYATSLDQRAAALASLKTGVFLGLFASDLISADLAIATVICISIRDRLAGFHDWEEPIQIGTSIVESHGGPAAYIAANPTVARRFLVEQMACVELLGCMTTWYAPRLLSWDAKWITRDPVDELSDHIETVYGWNRTSIQFSARSMILADEYRQCMKLEAQQKRQPYPQVQQSLDTRRAALRVNSLALLDESTALRNETLMTPHSPRVILGNLINQACMVIWIRSAVLGFDPHGDVVQGDNLRLLELLDEAMARGVVQGLLLPMTWAAAIASPVHRPHVDRLFSFLQPQYHLERSYMHRLRTANWPEWVGIQVTGWEAYMREHGYYAPVF